MLLKLKMDASIQKQLPIFFLSHFLVIAMGTFSPDFVTIPF